MAPQFHRRGRNASGQTQLRIRWHGSACRALVQCITDFQVTEAISDLNANPFAQIDGCLVGLNGRRHMSTDVVHYMR